MIVGITGRKGAGKDTAADALVARFKLARVSFAAPLKEMLATLLANTGMTPEDIHAAVYGDAKEKPIPALANRSGRYAMQTLGTEWGRQCIAPDLWINIAGAAIDNLAQGHAVVTDVRFVNEAEMIVRRGGILCRILRPTSDNSDHHVSEIGLNGCSVHLEIHNCGTIQQFQASVVTGVEQAARRLGIAFDAA
jgi:phosphosulfolactate synthase (CoM biosynthesis protein A)